MTDTQLKSIKNKIKKEFANKTFGGISGESEVLQYDYIEFTNYCSGIVTIGIGSGNFKNELLNVIRLSIAWGEYYKAFTARLEELGVKY